MGVFGAASNVALALAPVLGAWTAERFGFSTLFVVSAVVAAPALGLTFCLSETVPQRRRVPFDPASVLSRNAFFPATILFCLMTTYGVQVALLPLYVQSLKAGNPGVFFLVFALVIAGVRRYGGQLSDRFGRAPVTAAGTLLAGLAMAALALGGDLTALILAGILYGIGFGTAEPALMAWTVDRVPPEERGKAMGTFYTALELGIGTGAIGFGLILGLVGYPFMFVTAGVLALAGGALALTRFRR